MFRSGKGNGGREGMRKKNILFLIEIYLNSNVVYFPPLESYYSSRIILAFMNRLHSPAIFQFHQHYSISFEERNDSLKSVTISKRSKIPIIGITIITIIVNKDVSSKRSFFIDILFAYDVAYGPRTRKRKREKGSVSFSRSGVAHRNRHFRTLFHEKDRPIFL